MNSFTDILGKLPTYDDEMPDDEKASKLIRTLPNSFAPLAMIQTVESIDVKRLVTVVQSKLARRMHFRKKSIRYLKCPQCQSN